MPSAYKTRTTEKSWKNFRKNLTIAAAGRTPPRSSIDRQTLRAKHGTMEVPAEAKDEVVLAWDDDGAE